VVARVPFEDGNFELDGCQFLLSPRSCKYPGGLRPSEVLVSWVEDIPVSYSITVFSPFALRPSSPRPATNAYPPITSMPGNVRRLNGRGLRRGLIRVPSGLLWYPGGVLCSRLQPQTTHKMSIESQAAITVLQGGPIAPASANSIAALSIPEHGSAICPGISLQKKLFR